MTHHELFAAYGEKFGLSECRFDDSGVAVLDMGDDLAVFVESRRDGERILLHASVQADRPGAGLLARLLASNLYCEGGESPIAAYDEWRNEIVVLLEFDVDGVTAEDFEDRLSEIVASAEFWRKVAREGEDSVLAETTEDEPGAPGPAVGKVDFGAMA